MFDCLKPSCGHKVNWFVFQTFVALAHSRAVCSEANGWTEPGFFRIVCKQYSEVESMKPDPKYSLC